MIDDIKFREMYRDTFSALSASNDVLESASGSTYPAAELSGKQTATDTLTSAMKSV